MFTMWAFIVARALSAGLHPQVARDHRASTASSFLHFSFVSRSLRQSEINFNAARFSVLRAGMVKPVFSAFDRLSLFRLYQGANARFYCRLINDVVVSLKRFEKTRKKCTQENKIKNKNVYLDCAGYFSCNFENVFSWFAFNESQTKKQSEKNKSLSIIFHCCQLFVLCAAGRWEMGHWTRRFWFRKKCARSRIAR